MHTNREHEELVRTFEKEDRERKQREQAHRIQRWEQIPTLADLPDERVEWLVDGCVPSGGVTLLAGESGSYKTWLALVLSRSVVNGGTFLGRRCLPRDVLYLDRENSGAVIRTRGECLGLLDVAAGVRPDRVGTGPRHLCSSAGLSFAENETNDSREIQLQPPDGGPPAPPLRESPQQFHIWGGWNREMPPAIGDERLLELARERRPLIIVDSLIRFHDQDENSATGMNIVMQHFRALANAGAAVVVLHHKPKGEGSQYRGSSDIRAGVDVAFAISKDSTTGLVKFACFKNRLAEEFTLTLRPELSTPPGDFAVTDSPAQEQVLDAVEILKNLLAKQPGMSLREILQRAGLPQKKTIRLLHSFTGKHWRQEKPDRRTTRYYLLPEAGEEVAFEPDEELWQTGKA